MYNQLAKIALELIAKVSVPANDTDLNAVMQTRNMLHGIARGELVVGKPVPEPTPDSVK